MPFPLDAQPSTLYGDAAETAKLSTRPLVALTSEDGLAPEELAEALGLSVTKTEYLLDLLKEKELVGSRDYVGRPSEFYLKKGGRKHLIERGLTS